MSTSKRRMAIWLAVALIVVLAAGGPMIFAQAPLPHAPRGPGSVELEYFIGTALHPSHILLEWQSVSEIETQGYRLFRGVTPDPNAASLLVPFIPSPNPGTTPGAYFSHEDSFNLTPGVVYYYWIEDRDLGDVWHQHRDDPSLNPIVPWGCSIYDVVCDFVIDTQDISAIASLWNCVLGSVCYDDHFDVNVDDVIDVLDAMLTASRWGCLRTDACYN